MKRGMVLVLALLLCACASTKPAKCKGGNKRPVNAGQQVGAELYPASFQCVS